MDRIECPECQTQYTTQRCGISLMPEESRQVTIACRVCTKQFDVLIEPNYVTDEAGWFARYILRREPSMSLRGHTITSTKVR
jgi:hypothetical protein